MARCTSWNIGAGPLLTECISTVICLWSCMSREVSAYRGKEGTKQRERGGGVVCEREERVSDIAGPSTRGREAEQNPTMAPYIPQRHFKTRTVVGSLFVLMRPEMLALYCFLGIAPCHGSSLGDKDVNSYIIFIEPKPQRSTLRGDTVYCEFQAQRTRPWLISDYQ